MPAADVVRTWEHLVRYHRVVITAMDQNLRDRCGQPLEDYDVLHQLSVHEEPLRMGELAERLLVANSSCHRIVARLVAAGQIARTRGAVDRREVFTELTSEGRRIHRRMAAIHTRDIERFFGAPLSLDDRAHLDAALERLLAAD